MGSAKGELLITKTGVKLRCVTDNGAPVEHPAVALPMWVHGCSVLRGWPVDKRNITRESQRRYGAWLLGQSPT